MIGKIYVSICPFYDNKTHRQSFKKRPVLLIGNADNNGDYVVLPVSSVTHQENLDPYYDMPIIPASYPLLQLEKQSYIRAHKQTIMHSATLLKEISDLKATYPDLFLQVLAKMEEFQKKLIDKALC